MRNKKWAKLISMALVACLLALSLGTEASAQRRNREAGKKKAAKRVGIGAAIGAGAGGLIGGGKGALVGAGMGAGGGALYHLHKKRSYSRRRRR